MSTSSAHRRRAAGLSVPALFASLAWLASLPALATDAAAQDRSPRRAHVGASLGLMAGAPGIGAGSGSLAGVLEMHASLAATPRLAWTIVATYARADGASEWCTPAGGTSAVGPGCFTYDHEAVLAAVGLEYELRALALGGDPLRLALTGDVGAGSYHEAVRGDVPGFPRIPTQWHAMGPVASLGLVAARPLGTRLEGVVAGRLVVADLWTLLFGVAPTPQPALSIGLRW